MKKIFFPLFIILAIFLLAEPASAASSLTTRLKGRLLLQVEDRGRIWYVDPVGSQKHEVTFANALELFKKLSLGITNSDLNKIPIDPEAVSDQLDTDNDGFSDKSEVQNGYHPEVASNPDKRGNDKVSPYPALMNRLKGRLLLQVEDRGRIWYVDLDGKRWEVTWGNLMSLFTKLALGIKNTDLDEVGEWQTYHSNSYGFEFQFPTSYSIKPSSEYALYLINASDNASIFLRIDGQFNLEIIKNNYAPTGLADPPKKVILGKNTFYYYGPGGGGVNYPDQYFYNLNGQLLIISFDGPYDNSKTPTDRTKKMESKLLSTFKIFKAVDPTAGWQTYHFEGVVYKKGDSLISLDFKTGEKTNMILNNPDLIDFDLSEDNNWVARSFKESGFDGNSDITLYNMESSGVKRLTQKNDIASFNPKVSSANNKVLYVRRTYDSVTSQLSDGEIWSINLDGDIDSSKKLFSADIISNLATETCVSEEEKKSVKIGIYDVSPDGKSVAYWKKGIGAECSGLWQYPYYSNIDGTDFLTEKFKQQNIFVYENKNYNWDIYKINWQSDGSFVVGNQGPIPFSSESIYYYDASQNKKWGIIDAYKKDYRDYFSQVFLLDAHKLKDDTILLVYKLYFNQWDNSYYEQGKFVGEKYLWKKIKIGTDLVPNDLMTGKLIFASEGMDQLDRISDIKISDDDSSLLYVRKISDSQYGFYKFDIASGIDEKIDEFNEQIVFDL
ncbi:hypothetical protein GYA54_03805 [Candidatus Kuenenbacteria bacterium]|nr:hypothetical protein [Candidatus Kuenenbacteria bacterium]